MSTTRLDPTVVRKLRDFARRRFRLLLMRGVCAAIVTFLIAMTVVALVDWYWLLSDQMRWSISSAAYALTIGVVWIICLRKIVHTPAAEDIARDVENAAPELRENLLSALELATDDPTAIYDSPVFRGLLQNKVAMQMATVRVPALLPLRLLSKWMIAAFIVAIAAAVLVAVPDPRFRTLAVRAILPGANIDRVSRIDVEILLPTPSSLTVARDETVAIVARVSGGAVGSVTLETLVPGQSPRRQLMRARAQSEFAANIHVADNIVEYRILAGDAVTRKHTISSKERPQVIAIQKTYHFPDYSGLAQHSVTEPHGDLLVLSGTRAELQLELNQNVSEAELQIDTASSNDVTSVPLTRNNQGHWCANLTVDEAAIYKVHLVSRETGFTNPFSPRYEIRPLPDLIPRAGFVGLQETNLLLPPGDILALKGMAEDDLPLVSLHQEISLNGDEWLSAPLNVTVAATDDPDRPETDPQSVSSGIHRVDAAWEWDLLNLKLKTGDQVLTRLVATDRKGNRGESVPIRIVVAAQEFDPDRHVVMEAKAALYPAFVSLAKITDEQKTAAMEIIERLRNTAERTPEDVALDRASLMQLSVRMHEAAGDVLENIHQALREMPGGADACDLDLAGRLTARLHEEHSQTPHYLLQAMQHTQDPERIKRDLDELKRAFERAADDARSAAFHFQNLVSHNIVAAVALDFDALLQQQTLVVNSPTQTWARLLRQESVVLNQMQFAEQLLYNHESQLPAHLQNQFRQLLDWTQQRREQLEQATESEEKLPELQRLAQNLLKELTDRQRMDVIDGGLAERLNQARREFDQRSGSLFEPLSQLTTATQQENQLTTQAAEAADSIKAAALTDQAARFIAEVDLRHRRSLDQLRSRRELTQSRQDADSQFAADAGLTQRAVTSVLNQHRQRASNDSAGPDAFREIAPAYRILEAGHDVNDVLACLAQLLRAERWGSQNLPARIDHPRQWDVIQKGLETAVNKLRAAGVSNEIMSRLDQTRGSPAAQEANRKITQRRWVREHLVAADAALAELQDQLLPLQSDLQPVMAAARAAIAKYAPTIPQMAEQAAAQLRELEKQTSLFADQIEEKSKTPELSLDSRSPAPLAELRQEQQRINRQIDDLFDALVEDANSQDLLETDQRERARDADDSIAMVQEPARRMNQALDEAATSPSPDQQAKNLARATEQQEKTAKALDLVAKHFDSLDQHQEVAATRAELRAAESELGIANRREQQFTNLDQLTETALRDPADLIQELEAELQRNPAMRQGLSEIAQKTIQEARNALQDAAQRDQEIQRANERSDAAFQAKKKTLTESLHELGREASDLSRQLVAQAHAASSQAKTPEAVQKFAETQQKLNEAAGKANSANEGELQADLNDKLKQTSQLLATASELLTAAKDQSASAKTAEIHGDDKARENARKDLETRRQKFVDQRKKDADAVRQRAENAERQADQQLRAAQNSLQQTERQTQQAKKNLERKPEDNNLKRALAQAESAQQAAQGKVDQTGQQKEIAAQTTAEMRAAREALNQIPLPALTEKNPAAQLAEDFATEAAQTFEQLNQKAQELAAQSNFGNQLNPAKQQLTAATTQQQRVQRDVERTADDLERTSRHERRLANEPAAAALKQAADNVDQVASTEVADARQQLQTAGDAAPETPPSPDSAPNDHQPALAANKALADSETALRQQADSLSGILTPLQETLAASAQAAEPTAGSSPPASTVLTETPSSTGPQSPSGSETGTPHDAAPAPLTPDQLAAGRQLAQTLDELDRLPTAASNAAAVAAVAAEQSALQQALAQRPSLAQAAQSQQSRIAAARALAQQQAPLSAESAGFQTEGTPAYEGETGAFVVRPTNRTGHDDWGKLRAQAAEDLTGGRREVVSEEYRRSVEAYFRVLAERAQRKAK